MRCLFASLVVPVISCASLGCSATAPPPLPPSVPPTPATVTVENPGGDAADPEWAALDRLAHEAWGTRRDRTNSLIVPLPDARNWQRVRLWGYPTRAAFRFGDDHYGVLALWYNRAAGASDPASCLAHFIDEARPVAEGYGVRVLGSRVMHMMQKPAHAAARPMVVQVVDADVQGLFHDSAYAGALASYASWPGTCLIQGFVVVASKHKDLATRVRDRWVDEAASRLTWHPHLTAAPAFEDR